MLTVKKDDLDRLTEALYKLGKGNSVEPLQLPENYPEDELHQLYHYFNTFLENQNQIMQFIYALSNGDLNYQPPKGTNAMLQPFKNLQASLKHLTWVTTQVASGDFDHYVDFMGEFSKAFNDMTRQLKEAFEEIKVANDVIRKDKDRIRHLLSNVLPEATIAELESHGISAPRSFDDVVVFMSDITNFTKASSEIDPVMLIDELNSLFSEFDNIINMTSGERIKTIGDAYMAVWGMHNKLENPAELAVDASLKMIEFLKERNALWPLKWEMRIGLHVGSVVGGVVGKTKFIYDIFGDTVNMASRLESHSEPLKINISTEMYSLVGKTHHTEYRGKFDVKGKGECKMYFVTSRKE